MEEEKGASNMADHSDKRDFEETAEELSSQSQCNESTETYCTLSYLPIHQLTITDLTFTSIHPIHPIHPLLITYFLGAVHLL